MEEEEKTLDELWDEGTQGTDEEPVATEQPIPDDDSDVLDEESESTETDDEPASTPESPFTEAQLQRLAAFMQERDEAVLREAQKRARQSVQEQDKRIKEQLAPLVDQFKRLEEQGLYTREDSQREYATAYQKTAREIEAREAQEAQAALYQRWLAQQPAQQQQAQTTPVPYEHVKQIASTEVTLQNILDQSGLEDGDPELTNVPLKITHEDPKEAEDYFRFKVASAVQAKQQRLQASAKPKPFIDMGTGGGAGAGNPLAGIGA